MMEITDKDTKINILDIEKGRKLVKVTPLSNDVFIPITNFETKYPLELIKKILEVKGGAYLCDELSREESLDYVQKDLQVDLKTYFNFSDFKGKRILDFGCGSGASSMILSRFFPDSEIIGVELDEKLLSIAKERLNFYQYQNVKFYLSPNGSQLPQNIGKFDLVVMSAVFEHLLPDERKNVIPLVWSSLNKNGCLFLNMTPHRYFPIEHHTTGLPFINYLPDSLTYSVSKKFSKRIDPTEPWEMLLRRGIRGATENEILALLDKESNPKLIEPSSNTVKDRIDLWYSQLNQANLKSIKRVLKIILKLLKATTGVVLVPNLSLVYSKGK